MLTRENCKGIWSAIPMCWDEDYQFDKQTFKDNIIKLADGGADCVYTTGSTGEFYALNFEEFKLMVDALMEATEGKNVITAVGTTSLNTTENIKKIEYCSQKGVDCVMPAFPCWLKPKDEECLLFLKDVCSVSKDIAVLHYNHERTKRLFAGKDYKRVLKDLPKNFIGSKSGKSDFMFYAELIKETPELVHLAADSMIVPAMMLGGKAFVTILYNMNPQPIVNLYNLCKKKDWEKAMKLQQYLSNFIIEVVRPVWDKGYYDPAIDNALMYIGGFLKIERRIRKPYLPVPIDLIEKMKKITKEKYSQLIYK